MNKMITALKRIYYRIFRVYRRLDIQLVTYHEADQIIRDSVGKPEREQWVIATPEEDRHQFCYGMVYLERRERISV